MAAAETATALTAESGAQTAAITARDLSVNLGGAPALRSVSFAARRGEVAGLIGPNGAGKSTLLRGLAGLLKPDAGSVLLGGTPLNDVPAGERARRIAFMPQHDAAHPFTALETVLMARYPHLGRFELEGRRDREIAREAMRRTETGDFEDRQLDTLSGGERQRVVLARALAQQADAMLLDEPAASLDLKRRLSMMEILREEAERRNVAVVAAMHDVSLAARYCDRLVVLSKGRIAAEGTASETLTPENLRSAFEVEAVIEPDLVTGRPQVSLLGPSGEESVADGRKRVAVHVVCGAGSGRDLMHQLVSAGYTVTCGVLGLGDTDRAAAEALGISFAGAPPFSPIDDEQHGRHLAMVRDADVTVLCDMAVGPNNLRNLAAAESARRLVIIGGPPIESLDYTGGEATVLRRRMAERWPTVERNTLLRHLAAEFTLAT